MGEEVLMKSIKFLLLLSFALFNQKQVTAGEKNYQIIELDHPQREEILATVQERSENKKEAQNKIIQAALGELEIPLEGRLAKKRYGANFYEWWCSEFSRFVLYRSNYFKKDEAKGQRILAIGLTSKLINFFQTEEKGEYFKSISKKTKIEAGDYLAYTGSGETPNHSSIVIYVSYEKNFILTAEGNASLNNRVALIKRPIIVDGSYNKDFFFLGKIKN
jgi:hypothetical protein